MDLSLNIRGDSSGAVGALNDAGGAASSAGEDAAKSSVKWAMVAQAMTAAASAAIKFGVDAVKAFAESERVQKQLERATGSYSAALDKQAQALSRLYAVDDDIIKQSQTLLAQWGGVGAATKDVETAALNLAAAMGGDLKSATTDLIRNVESGGTGLAKMGIHFKATGDKGKDLAAAVAAINAKLGGTAAADADTLSGSLQAASLGFEDIQKNLGGSVAKFLEWSGVVGRLTEAMRGLNTALGFGDVVDQSAKNEAYLQIQEHLNANLQQRAALLRGVVEIEARGEQAPKSRAQIAILDRSIEQLKEIIRLKNLEISAGDPALPVVAGATNKGMKGAGAGEAQAEKMAALHEKNTEEWKKYLDGIDTLEETAQAQEAKRYADELALEGKRVSEAIDVRKAGQKAYDDIRTSEEKKAAEHAEKLAGIEKKQQEEATKDSMGRAKKRADEAASTGAAIGTAFVNALSEQLQKLAAGEEFDVALFVGDILASVIAVAGTVIGTAYGQPALGAAVGNLAAMGVRAGAGAISASGKKERKGAKKYHSGGPIGDEIDVPRYHSGGALGSDEMHIIAQRGEHMLSRRDVANMGGHAGVEAAKGGRGPTIVNNIQAIDTKSSAESFMSGLGQGMKRALRTGHGDVPRLLGAIPR